MKYGFDFYLMLSFSHGVKWKKNVSLNSKTTISDIYNTLYSSFEEFLLCSFVWADTPEGYSYWETLSEQFNSISFNRSREATF